jgi:hypothetical protein
LAIAAQIQQRIHCEPSKELGLVPRGLHSQKLDLARWSNLRSWIIKPSHTSRGCYSNPHSTEGKSED